MLFKHIVFVLDSTRSTDVAGNRICRSTDSKLERETELNQISLSQHFNQSCNEVDSSSHSIQMDNQTHLDATLAERNLKSFDSRPLKYNFYVAFILSQSGINFLAGFYFSQLSKQNSTVNPMKTCYIGISSC